MLFYFSALVVQLFLLANVLKLLFLDELLLGHPLLEPVLHSRIHACLDASAVALLLALKQRLDIQILDCLHGIEDVARVLLHHVLDVEAQPNAALDLVYSFVPDRSVFEVLVHRAQEQHVVRELVWLSIVQILILALLRRI